jgi:hypothetical protein
MEYQYQYQYSGAKAPQDAGAMGATPHHQFPIANTHDRGPVPMEGGYRYQESGATGQQVGRAGHPSPRPGPHHQFAMTHEGGVTSYGTTFNEPADRISQHGLDSHDGDSGTGAFPHGYFDRMPHEEIAMPTGPGHQDPRIKCSNPTTLEDGSLSTGPVHDVGVVTRREGTFPTGPTILIDDGEYHEIGGTMSHHDLTSSHDVEEANNMIEL